jgi:hypothetical protein
LDLLFEFIESRPTREVHDHAARRPRPAVSEIIPDAWERITLPVSHQDGPGPPIRSVVSRGCRIRAFSKKV